MKNLSCIFLLIIILNIGCKKTETDKAKGIPKYTFTADDENWIGFKLGDSMVFKNDAGQKVVYKATVKKRYYCPGYGTTWLYSDNPITYYDDHYEIEFRSSDNMFTISAEKLLPTGANRAAPPMHSNNLRVVLYWLSWNGNNNNRNVQVNLPGLVNETLDLNGSTYPTEQYVTANFINNLGNISLAPVIALNYHKNFGIVRYKELNGMVWNRVF